ncbi:MAG: glycosyltransferase [Dehalococcoidales bacterium]
MNESKISVIIPVLNQEKKIEQCLEAVFAQSLQPYEVIVVDGHSTDGTVEKAQRFPVKIFYQEYGAAGAARQIGVEKAEGEYLAFIDSDCIPDKNWLKTLTSEFEDDIVAVGGGMKNIGTGLWNNSINLSLSNFLGNANQLQAAIFREKRLVKELGLFNSIYRKKYILEVGGFNIHLAGADETELNKRISKKGKLLYTPDTVVLHDHGRGLREFAQNMYRYGTWRRQSRVLDLPAIPPLLAPLLLLSLIFTRWVFLPLLALYFIILVVIAAKFVIQEKNIRYFFSIPVVYLTEHICYIIGFWKEVLFPHKMDKVSGKQPS